MDALSSSVSSSFRVPTLHSTSPDLFHSFRTPLPSHLQPRHYLSSISKSYPISNTHTSFTHHKPFIPSQFSSSSRASSLRRSPVAHTHSDAASGYAAALLDVARCSNSLEKLEKDVRRLSRLVREESHRTLTAKLPMDERERGRVAKEVAEKGRFHVHLVRLLKMLAEKDKLGTVCRVLEELERIYDELSDTARVVLVSSASPRKTKEDDDQLLGMVAKRVHQLSGARRVKVRHFVAAESLPSSAP